MNALTSHMTIARLLRQPKTDAPMFKDPIEFAPPSKTECDPIADLKAGIAWLKTQDGMPSEQVARARGRWQLAFYKCFDAMKRKDHEAFREHLRELWLAGKGL